jgi:hypothetical protein
MDTIIETLNKKIPVKISVGKQSSDGLLKLNDSKKSGEILNDFNTATLRNKYYSLYKKYKGKYLKLKNEK